MTRTFVNADALIFLRMVSSGILRHGASSSAEVPPLIHLLNGPLSAVVSEEGVGLREKSADVPFF